MKRNIKIKTIVLVLLGLMYGQEAFSQVATEEILRDRYWQYRERTRRHFVKVGKVQDLKLIKNLGRIDNILPNILL